MGIFDLFNKKETKRSWQERLFDPNIANNGIPDFSHYPSYRVEQIERADSQQKFSHKKLKPGTFLWFKYNNSFCICRLLVSVSDLKKANIDSILTNQVYFSQFIMFNGWYSSLDEIKTLEAIAVIGAIEPSVYKVDTIEDYEIGIFGYLKLISAELAFKEYLIFYHIGEWYHFEGKDRMIHRAQYVSGEIRLNLPIYRLTGDEKTVLGYGNMDSKEFVFSDNDVRELFAPGYPFDLNPIFDFFQKLDNTEIHKIGHIPTELIEGSLGLEYQPRLREIVYELINRPLDMNYYEFAKLQGMDPSKFIYE